MKFAAGPGEPLGSAPVAERRAALDWLRAAAGSWLADAGEAPPAPAVLALGRMAWCHNLEPLLHRLAAESRLAPPSHKLAARWENAYFETLAINSALVERLRELLDRSRREGASLVVLKGLVTAARAYGDPALRPMSDVDLLCRESELAAVGRAAAAMGFRSGGEDAVYHLKLFHPGWQLTVELHFDLYDLIAGRGEFVRRALERPAEVLLEGSRLPALPLEMDLVFQLAHLLNHDFQGNLRGYLDVAALLHRHADRIDPERLGRELAAADLAPEFGRLVALLERLFHLTLPPALPRSDAPSLLALVEPCLLDPERHVHAAPLAEAAARPWRTRPVYWRRLLFPSRSRLRALAELESPSAPHDSLARRTASRTRHLLTTLRRGWLKLRASRRAGTPSPTDSKASLKRQVLNRR